MCFFRQMPVTRTAPLRTARLTTMLASACLSLSGCMVGPDYARPAYEGAIVGSEWHAVLPHGGKIENLRGWWRQFNDPTLSTLIESAQETSPTLDQAFARVEQSRAIVTQVNASLLPDLIAQGSVARRRTGAEPIVLQQTVSAGELDASWEIDLFGRLRRNRQAALAELQAATADWHDARVSLAAEVADAYMSLRGCEADVDLYTQQLQSQSETGRLTGLKVDAGFAPPASQELSEATIAQTRSMLENQRSLCNQTVNRLVALTGIEITALRARLAASTGTVPAPDVTTIEALPARVLSQRPDVAAAERRLAAASADIGVAVADRLPAVGIAGVVGINRPQGENSTRTWSIGPSLNLPLVDFGRRRAEVRRLEAVYRESYAGYRATVRSAVNEVEDALERLDAIRRRADSAREAVSRYQAYFQAAEASYNAGRTALIDLEDARRQVFASREALIGVEQEWAQAWIALYKAVGGGWDGDLSSLPARWGTE